MSLFLLGALGGVIAGTLYGRYMRDHELDRMKLSEPRDLVALVRKYATEIQNGRTPEDVYDHFQKELAELEADWTGEPGEDGVMGESIDVIVCLLDLIHVHFPEVTDEEINDLAIRKLEKWKRDYSNSIHGNRAA